MSAAGSVAKGVAVPATAHLPASEVPAVNTAVSKEENRLAPVMALTCRLTVDLPLPNFRVSDFLALHPGSIVASGWALTRDVPLCINGTEIGQGEMEGGGNRLAVRVTELA